MARILDDVDCPPHNVVHDIARYPNYYDPLYFPECYSELFATPSSVKVWLETSLLSHIRVCLSCRFTYSVVGVKLSVHWRDPYFLICSYVDGRLRQCPLSLENLQSKKYSHCQIVSKLCQTSVPVPPFANLNQNIDVYRAIAQEEPAWLFRSKEFYRLHLFQLPAHVLSLAARANPLFEDIGDPSKIETQKFSRSQLKGMCLSISVHIILICCTLIAKTEISSIIENPAGVFSFFFL
jgi:hypothetical protein